MNRAVENQVYLEARDEMERKKKREGELRRDLDMFGFVVKAVQILGRRDTEKNGVRVFDMVGGELGESFEHRTACGC